MRATGHPRGEASSAQSTITKTEWTPVSSGRTLTPDFPGSTIVRVSGIARWTWTGLRKQGGALRGRRAKLKWREKFGWSAVLRRRNTEERGKPTKGGVQGYRLFNLLITSSILHCFPLKIGTRTLAVLEATRRRCPTCHHRAEPHRVPPEVQPTGARLEES